ncbi:hypothetical protein FQN60_004304, partial [Etheostoma spectabile]
MFSLSELAPLNQHQSRSKLLKPWWEVFMDYLVVLMLMASVLACTEQLSRDRVVCVPLDPLVTPNTSASGAALKPSLKPHVQRNLGPNLHSTARGRRTHLVYQHIDSGTDSPLLKRSFATPPSPCPSTLSCNSTMSSTSQVHCPLSKPSGVVDSPRQVTSLDKSDGEQTRALFERVRKFRSHSESSDVIYKVYLAQTIFKLLMVTLILSYSIPLLSSLSFTHTCHPEEQALVGYTTFECIHVLSSLLRKLLVAYLTLLGLYGLLNLYTLSWMSHRELHLYHCAAAVDPSALGVLQDRLEILHLNFTQASEIPSWVLSLRNLHELHLSGRLNSDGGVGRSWALGSLRQLRHLRVLLQSLPPALFTLRRLQRLLLAGNLLEVLPAEVKELQLLTELDLSGNRVESLPPQLFSSCLELHILNVAHNSLGSLPAGVAALTRLCRLDLRSNSLEDLPAELGGCTGLHGGGLLVRDVLSRSCPRSGTYPESRSRPQSDSF